MEEIKRFMEKVQADESLQASLKELAQRKAGLDEVIALAEGHGFATTKENWEAAAKEAAQAGELNEEQLAAVSGGKNTDPPPKTEVPRSNEAYWAFLLPR